VSHPGNSVNVLVAVVVAVTSTLADAMVVGIALRQRFVRGSPAYRSCATDTWSFVPLDVTV